LNPKSNTRRGAHLMRLKIACLIKVKANRNLVRKNTKRRGCTLVEIENGTMMCHVNTLACYSASCFHGHTSRT
jgi:hypothetical protein